MISFKVSKAVALRLADQAKMPVLFGENSPSIHQIARHLMMMGLDAREVRAAHGDRLVKAAKKAISDVIPRHRPAVPDGFWLGELSGQGGGLCHVFSEYAGETPHRLPHTAVCGAATGGGARLVTGIPSRRICGNCYTWLTAVPEKEEE